MQKYDLENLLSDINRLLVANINATIDAVEAEKVAQGLPASSIEHIDLTTSTTNPSGYNGLFEQSWSPANLNVKNAIFYGVEDIQTQGIGPASVQTVKAFVEIIHTDSGNDILGLKRLARYSRAIKDIFESNFDRFPLTSNKIKIETVRPISFKLETDSSEEIRVGGVSITMAIA